MIIVADQSAVANALAQRLVALGVAEVEVVPRLAGALAPKGPEPPDLIMIDLGSLGESADFAAAKDICRSRGVPVVLLPPTAAPMSSAQSAEGDSAGGRGASRQDSELKPILELTKGENIGVLSILHNVMAQREAEPLLGEREQHFRSLIENSSDVVTILREDGEIRYQSPSIEHILGYGREELLGRNFREFVHPEDRARVEQAVRQAVQGPGPIKDVVYRFRHKDGSWRVLETVGQLWPTGSPGPKAVVANTRDITERVRLAEQFRQAQKMEAVGQLAGGVAHDFNNILAALLMHLGLLQAEPDLAPRMRAALAEMEPEIQRATTLTRQLLMFSRRQAPQVKPLDLNRLVAELLQMLRRLLGEQITVIWRPSDTPIWVEADAAMLEQAVMNLAVNARDAMPEGGSLAVRTGVAELEAGTTGAGGQSPRELFVCLEIADTGCGMDRADLQRAFEPFFTTKPAGLGTGLGLAAVREIVRLHRGWVEVESDLGQGSTFRLYLPALRQGPEAEAQPLAAEIRGGTETILLVEDEPSLLAMAARALRRSGYQVLEAANGWQALEYWEQHKEEIALVLTDLVLPEGLTGIGLAEQLKKSRPGVKVIISSGYHLELAQAKQNKKQGSVYLAKPYANAALIATVRKCLDDAPDLDVLAHPSP